MDKYVSFDVYDTLIKRVITVEELYMIMENFINNEEQIKCVDFCSKRLAAQKQLTDSKQDSYSIEDIYNNEYFKSLRVEEINRLIQIEEEFEIRNAVVCLEGKKLYDFYQTKYNIVCISDMYLHEYTIKQILKNNGYDIRKIYVSCDYRKCKRKKGLFKIVLSDLHISPKQLIHLGDALRSDFINPKLLGIKSLYIDRHKSQDDGFDILGPIVYEFCHWLHNKAKGRTLFFLMREGEIIQRYYHIIYPDDQSQLLPLSRQAIFKGMVYLLLQKERLEEIILICNQIKIFTLNDLVDTLEVSQNIPVEKNEKIEQWLENHRCEILSQLTEEAIGLDEMMMLTFKSHNLLVDLGWQGSMQDMLELYAFIKGEKITFEGLYLGTLNNNNKRGFLFDKENRKVWNNIMCFSGLLEVLFMQKQGSVKGVIKLNDELHPVYAESEFSEESMIIIKNVQENIINFLKYMRGHYNFSCLNINYRLKNLERWGCRPSKNAMKRYCKIEFWDNGKNKALVDEINFASLFHLKKMISSFMVSRWKTAYLKKIFHLNLQYEKIVMLLRKIQGLIDSQNELRIKNTR